MYGARAGGIVVTSGAERMGEERKGRDDIEASAKQGKCKRDNLPGSERFGGLVGLTSLLQIQ